MRTIIKAFLCTFISFTIYNYAILPITTPDLEIRQGWSTKDLEWNDEDIFWFIQVTDLHISKYVHLDIKPSLDQFFTTTLDTVKPKVVLASGDITDAKDFDGVNSFQVEEEWQTYSGLLSKHKVQEKTVYLDIRGNHDTFDVHHMDHSNNLHRLYSAKGPVHPSTYTYTMSHQNTNYSFFAVDATMKTGPKKVFNFLGNLEPTDFDTILAEKQKLSTNKQIFFGHFPASCIIAPAPGFKTILEGGLVYLSGHLHTLGGLAPQLYTLHRSGTPELELGDFKENRKYRILAIDNGILSFSDEKLNTWPTAIITNPKDSRFYAPNVEPIQKVLQSNEIRILAFSPHGIDSVQVSIDKGKLSEAKKHTNLTNVFTLPWNPLQVDSSIRKHTMDVTVKDNAGNIKNIHQTFNTDFTRLETSYKLYARILLMSNLTWVLQVLWILSILVSTLPILAARYKPSALRHAYSLSTSDKMAELVQFSPFFWLYLFMLSWLAIGPWNAVEILSGHTGIILPWAIYVKGHFLPSFYPYVASLIHLYLFHTPLFWSLVFKFKWRMESSSGKILLALSNIPVTLVLSSQAVMLLVLYYFPSKLGIFKEICILIAPMEITMIILGFTCNGLVSYWISQSRRTNN